MEVNPEKGMHCLAGERPLYHCQERENCNLLTGKKKKQEYHKVGLQSSEGSGESRFLNASTQMSPPSSQRPTPSQSRP